MVLIIYKEDRRLDKFGVFVSHNRILVHNPEKANIGEKSVRFINQNVYGTAVDNSNEVNYCRVLNVSSFEQNLFTY